MSDPRNKRTRAAKGESVYTEWFQLLVTPAQKANIDRISADRGITKSEWVRRAIDNYTVKHDSRRKAK